MALYYSGADGKKLIRNSFPHHMLMANLNVENKYLHPIDDRDYWEGITDEQKRFYLEKAEAHLDFIWLSVPAMETYYDYFVDPNHSHLGDRVFLDKREALLWLTIGECIENKGRFLHQIVDGVFSICEQSTWAPPSHFVQCGETKEWLPDPDDPVLDLYACGQAMYISITYALLKSRFDEVSPVICRRIEREIDYRIITPFLTRDLWWMCENLDLSFWSINNWTTAICYDILFTTLAMKLSKKTAYQVINKVIDCLDAFIDAYPDDGACNEGPGYWGGAIHPLICALELLEHVICGKTNIWQKSKIEKMCEYILNMRIHNDIYASVSDAHSYIKTEMSRLMIMYHEGKLFRNKAMMQEAVLLYPLMEEGERHPADYIFEFLFWEELKKSKAEIEKKAKSAWMPGVQIMSSHQCSDTGIGMYLCAKGGTNHESHNHNDIGNFIVYKNGKPIVVDAGIGLYTNTTFGEKRYTNWWANGFHHNIPVIGGLEQKEGAEYIAENVSCLLSEESDEVSMELKAAYRNSDKINSVKRRASLDRKKGIVSVEDIFDFKEPMTFDCVLILQNRPELTEVGIRCGEAEIVISGEPRHIDVSEIDLSYDSIFQESWGQTLYKAVIHVDAKEKGNLKISIS